MKFGLFLVVGLFIFIFIGSATVTIDNLGESDVPILNLERGDKDTTNATFGEMWYHNHTATQLTIPAGVNISLFFRESKLNDVSFNEGLFVSNFSILEEGYYKTSWHSIGDGQNNYVYYGSVYVNNVNNGQENCESEKKMSAGGDVVTMSGACLLYLSIGDQVGTYITADTTGNGNYYGGNMNIHKLETGISVDGSSTNFLDLSDTPRTYVGDGGECVAVTGAEDGLEFISCAAGGSVGTDYSNVFMKNQSTTGDAGINVSTGLGGWFKGLFNWIIGTNSTAYLGFNGSSLVINEDKLNETINNLIDNSGIDTNASTECSGDQVLLGNTSCASRSDFSTGTTGTDYSNVFMKNQSSAGGVGVNITIQSDISVGDDLFVDGLITGDLIRLTSAIPKLIFGSGTSDYFSYNKASDFFQFIIADVIEYSMHDKYMDLKTNNLTTEGNITANHFFGNGSQLTSIRDIDTNASTECSGDQVLLGNTSCASIGGFASGSADFTNVAYLNNSPQTFTEWQTFTGINTTEDLISLNADLMVDRSDNGDMSYRFRRNGLKVWKFFSKGQDESFRIARYNPPDNWVEDSFIINISTGHIGIGGVAQPNESLVSEGNITANYFFGNGSGLNSISVDSEWHYNQTSSSRFYYNQTSSSKYYYNQTDTQYYYNQTDTQYYYNQTDTQYYYNQTIDINLSNKIFPNANFTGHANHNETGKWNYLQEFFFNGLAIWIKNGASLGFGNGALGEPDVKFEYEENTNNANLTIKRGTGVSPNFDNLVIKDADLVLQNEMYLNNFIYSIQDPTTSIKFADNGEGYEFNAKGDSFMRLKTSLTKIFNFNDDLQDIDVQIKGTTDAALFFTDAGNDEVGIGTTNPAGKLEVKGDVVRQGFFQAYSGINQSSNGAIRSINFTQQTRLDGVYYGHNLDGDTDEIYVNNTGWYRISYGVGWENSGLTDRVVMRTWLEDDGVEVIPSKTDVYLRSSAYGRYGSNTASFLAQITGGSTLEVMTDGQNGANAFGLGQCDSNTIGYQTWITMEKV